jgi:large subunit ribosomal protein L29
MTTKELRELAPAELDKKLREARQHLLHMSLRKQTGQVEKTHEYTVLRRDIARMLTLLREKNTASAA